jgi:hypothetical protein
MCTTPTAPLSQWFDRERFAEEHGHAPQTTQSSVFHRSYECRGVGCKSSYCRQCGFAKGMKLRRKLVATINRWQACKPVMVTLTQNPELFGGPREGLDHVRTTGAISKLAKKLRRYCKSGLYFCVVEYHESGWPHWHMMLDAEYIPASAIRDAWYSLGPKDRDWTHNPHGITDVRSPKKFKSKEHRFNYLTKYITKIPKQGFPDWLLDAPDLIYKRYTSSHGLFCPDREEEKKKGTTSGEEYDRTADTIRGRVSLCGTKTALMCNRDYVGLDGEAKRHTTCVAKLPMGPAEFAEIEGLELTHGRCAISGEAVTRWSSMARWQEKAKRKQNRAREKHDAAYPLLAGQYDGS